MSQKCNENYSTLLYKKVTKNTNTIELVFRHYYMYVQINFIFNTNFILCVLKNCTTSHQILVVLIRCAVDNETEQTHAEVCYFIIPYFVLFN